MLPNLFTLIGCAFIPLIFGFIWYHPKVFGKTWQTSVGLTDEAFSTPPKIYQFGLSLLLNFLLAFGVFIVTVHQTHVLALTGPNPEALRSGVGLAFMQEYGNNFTSASHGLTHGIFIAFLAFALPLIGSPAIWEKKGIKYVLVNGGYWLLTLTTMAIIISKWGWQLV